MKGMPPIHNERLCGAIIGPSVFRLHNHRWAILQRFKLIPLLIFANALPAMAFAQSETAPRFFEGKARIVDGDTLEIGVHLVHLLGVDAPEIEQQCQRGSQNWRCGWEATYALAALIENNWVSCQRHGADETGAAVATCRMGGPNGVSINDEVVRQGWALAVPPDGNAYIDAEQQAKSNKSGIWSGTFTLPENWRQGRDSGKTGTVR